MHCEAIHATYVLLMACNLVCCAVAKYLFINGLDFLTDAKIAIVCAIHSLRFIEIYVVFGFW